MDVDRSCIRCEVNKSERWLFISGMSSETALGRHILMIPHITACPSSFTGQCRTIPRQNALAKLGIVQLSSSSWFKTWNSSWQIRTISPQNSPRNRSPPPSWTIHVRPGNTHQFPINPCQTQHTSLRIIKARNMFFERNLPESYWVKLLMPLNGNIKFLQV